MFSSNTSQQSEGYQIQRSLRFNSADSAYLNRTPASASNRKTWTWSSWVKRVNTGTVQHLFRTNATPITLIRFEAADSLYFYSVGVNAELRTTAVYRDFSAWYHVVWAVDTTQAVASNRIKLYVNGVQVTSFSTELYPAQNTDLGINTANAHAIGATTTPDEFSNQYLTEINFIDGQALTPSSFGQTNANTGVWEPKPYAGTYGTNGFYLNFSDNSNTTATTLGKDYSGNGNNWTPNNFSVSAGAGNDSLVDVPTPWGVDTGVGGTVRGNYCTLNPLSTGTNCSPTPMVLTDGNLNFSYNRVTSGGTWAIGTMSIPSTGKWYFEFTTQSGTNGLPIYGIASSQQNRANAAVQNLRSYNINNGNKITTDSSGSFVVNTSYGAVATFGDVIGVAVDCDAGTLAFYKNGVSQGTAFTDVTSSGVEFSPCIYGGAADAAAGAVNFGQRPFAYTAPSGFKALCTQNLPTPTIGATASTQAGKFFNPVLYTGTGSARSVTGVGFQPDLVWIKNREASVDHGLNDAVRGAGKFLYSNLINAEGSFPTDFVSFDSNGFSLGTGTGAVTNTNGVSYVAWNWKANGAGVTNTAGSVTSTVSANTTSGFSVVTYTGTGANATVGHGLGSVPKMIIVKGRTGSLFWTVYHASAAASAVEPKSTYMILNTTDAAINNSTPWNSTAPTSSVFSVGTASVTNNSGTPFVAYCFAEVQGFSKFGSYTGNGSTDGPFVYCGFRPAYLLVKRTDTTGDWYIIDAVREGYNVIGPELFANLSNAEALGSTRADFLSNGFKLRSSGPGWNASGGTYIFAAFASAPQKFALAR